jgi:hypothetical protein
MSQSLINDPNHWRERAREARSLANLMIDPESKRMMLGIAQEYEELAHRAERRTIGKQPT